MSKKTGYLFLDVETTGNNPYVDEVWECSTVFDTFIDGAFYESSGLEIQHIKHEAAPSMWVLANTEYSQWFTPERRITLSTFPVVSARQFIGRLLVELAQKNFNELYLVGQNPAFDVTFLEKLRKTFYERENFPWSYRLISVGDLLMGYANGISLVPRDTPNSWEEFQYKPASLKEAYFKVFPTKEGEAKPKFHNSAHDVRATRDIFYGILDLKIPPVNAFEATSRARGG